MIWVSLTGPLVKSEMRLVSLASKQIYGYIANVASAVGSQRRCHQQDIWTTVLVGATREQQAIRLFSLE